MIRERGSVIKAIQECDRLGREEFLQRYEYGATKGYVLVYEGKHYDSKAIVGVAHGYENPEQGPLKAKDFSGGAATVQRRLERLGFEVERLNTSKTHENTDAPQQRTQQVTNADFVDTSCIVNKFCGTLHQWLNELPILQFPFPPEQIPRNGIYVMFEDGEQAHPLTCLQHRCQRLGIGQTVIISNLNQCRLGQSAVPHEFFAVDKRHGSCSRVVASA